MFSRWFMYPFYLTRSSLKVVQPTTFARQRRGSKPNGLRTKSSEDNNKHGSIQGCQGYRMVMPFPLSRTLPRRTPKSRSRNVTHSCSRVLCERGGMGEFGG